MIIGSYNSWSYLPVSSRWMKWLRPFFVSQDGKILDQYEAGVRCFDLQIRYDNKENGFVHSNGIISHTGYFIYDLVELHHKAYKGEKIYVRIKLNGKVDSKVEYMFRMKCRYLESRFPYLNFVGGSYKKNGREWNVWTFSTKQISICEKVAPFFAIRKRWALKNNDDIIKKGTDKDCIMIDFV